MSIRVIGICTVCKFEGTHDTEWGKVIVGKTKIADLCPKCCNGIRPFVKSFTMARISYDTETGNLLLNA